LSFKHKLDCHLGEMLRRRPGDRMPRLTGWIGRAVIVALVVLSAGAQGAGAAPAAKPKAAPVTRAPRAAGQAAPGTAAAADTILARLPHKTITARSFLVAWAQLDPRYRPVGTGPKAKRAFLDQLIQKEVLAAAAVAEPFTMGQVESAQFVAFRKDLFRRALLKRLVADSAVVTSADLDSAREMATRAAGGKPSAALLHQAARPFAERRRAQLIDARIRAEINPVWDESVAALLVAAYGKLDQSLPDTNKPMSLQLPNRNPPLAPADTGRVLVKSTLGDMTAKDFAQRFLGFNPFMVRPPSTVDTLKIYAQEMLGETWVDRACADPRVQNDPLVVAAVNDRRESMALDRYYDKHITARADTSEATLRARYRKSPSTYSAPAHWIITRMSTPSQAAGDSVQRALADGAPWDSICARRLRGSEEGVIKDCENELQLPDPYPDTIFAAVLTGLKPGEAAVLPIPQTTASDERRLVVRLVWHKDRRYQSFEEARPFILRDVTQDESEQLLEAEIARLKIAAHVITFPSALARVDLAAWARQVAPPEPAR